MRYFNEKPVELLAPAGNFSIFQRIVRANCDAVYFGGKRFNMRLHRGDFNLTDEELAEAVPIARTLGKKAYITVNNMYTQEELPDLERYLGFLAEISPDAILIQDLGIIPLIKNLGITLPLHASVMMNVHNIATVQALLELGVSRVVLSRELPLSYGKELADSTGMEIEYFVHGDMCVVHGGQCLYSGILFGKSANQGKCLKPCRWRYDLERGGTRVSPGYPLAVKDMYLYEHIPELIHNHIRAFKIEGRMRELDFLEGLVNAYGDAIDRYIADPLGYDPREGADFLWKNRKRDFSRGYAFGKPGLENINTRLEGTGTFYSTGKPFSAATEEPPLTAERVDIIRERLRNFDRGVTEKPELTCRVQTPGQARICFKLGVDRVYLSGEVFYPEKPFSRETISSLCGESGRTGVYLAQSRMTFDMDLEEFSVEGSVSEGLAGFLSTNLGGLRIARKTFPETPCFGDYPLNIQNSAAWEFYREQGLSGFTISPEIRLLDLAALLAACGEWGELIVFGSPTVMYFEHDLFANFIDQEKKEEDTLDLIDDRGWRHPVFKDRRGRNHMLLYKDISCLPFLGELCRAGLRRFRLEASHLSLRDFEEAVSIFRRALDNPGEARELAMRYQPPRQGFTPGALASQF